MADFVIDAEGLRVVLRAPGGIVGRHVLARAHLVEAASRAFCPRRSGHLAESIHTTAVRDIGSGIEVRVGSDNPYAIYVHEGTKAHVIEARNARVLAFNVGSERVFATRVNHPGTKGRRFLGDALHLAV